ncbi:hypothetical protein TI04_04880 [Achromatium sp. WMS2]|nr:hypothetical protein TI04_04880 [Achromatium sp. WMS2]
MTLLLAIFIKLVNYAMTPTYAGFTRVNKNLEGGSASMMVKSNLTILINLIQLVQKMAYKFIPLLLTVLVLNATCVSFTC